MSEINDVQVENVVADTVVKAVNPSLIERVMSNPTVAEIGTTLAIAGGTGWVLEKGFKVIKNYVVPWAKTEIGKLTEKVNAKKAEADVKVNSDGSIEGQFTEDK